MKRCDICGDIFENGRIYSNHIRWKHRRTKHNCQFCNEEYDILDLHEPSCLQNPNNVKVCKLCGKMITGNTSQRSRIIFCNQSCAAIYNNRERSTKCETVKCCICGKNMIRISKKKKRCDDCRMKEQIRRQVQRNKILTQQIRDTIPPKGVVFFECVCAICNVKFRSRYKKAQTCNKKCFKELLSLKSKANSNCGGETGYKKYRYKEIYMDSTWELDIAKWMDERQIEWKRSRKIMFWWTDKNGNRRRYYPDFYLPKYDLYLDPKNKYLLKQDEYKLNQVIKENNINLVYGHKDLILEKLMGL